jgi:hypothetical protein
MPDQIVNVNVITDAGKIKIEEPNKPTLEKGKDQVRWCITNNSEASLLRLVIHNFRERQAPHRVHPFGDNSPEENYHHSELVPKDHQNCRLRSRLATGEGVGKLDKVEYKYDIIAYDENGNRLTDLDPMVILSGGGLGGDQQGAVDDEPAPEVAGEEKKSK